MEQDGAGDIPGETGVLSLLLGALLILLLGVVGVGVFVLVVALSLVAIAVYAVVVVPANLVLLVLAGVSAFFYWFKTRFDGKAIMQRRLEGRIPLLKQKALELGLDLVELGRQEDLGAPEGPDSRTSTRRGADASEGQPLDESASDTSTPLGTDDPDWQNLNRGEIKQLRRLFGFDDRPSRARFNPWLPLIPRLNAWFTPNDGGRADDVGSGLGWVFRPVRDFLWGLLGWVPGGSETRPIRYSRGFIEDFLRSDGVDDERFPPRTRWVYDTMFLLNTADVEMRRSMGTAYEAYLMAKRNIVEGEYTYHKLKAKIDSGTEEEDGEQFLRSEASVVLYGLSDYDEQTRKIVTDILCDHQSNGGTEPKPKPGLKIAELKQALKELHEYRLREYRRFEILRINILMFVGLPIVSLIGLLIVVPSFMSAYPSLITTLVPLTELVPVGSPPPLPVEGVVIHSEQMFFSLVLGFGALGAALSGMRKIEHDTNTSESLESILGYWLALVRMSIGAISAFVVLVFLSSGLLDQTILSLPLVLGISAASGVSERLALKAISSFESRALPETEREGKTKAESARPG